MTYPKPDVTEKARLVTILSTNKTKAKDEVTYGGIKEMSVLEPPPGVVGFLRVVSTSVQRSPLSPQLPSPMFTDRHRNIVVTEPYRFADTYALVSTR